MSNRRGVLVLVIALTGLGMLLMFAALRWRRPAPTSTRTVLTFELPRAIEEDDPPAEVFSPGFWRQPNLTVYDLVEVLRYAADDGDVRALVLHVRPVDWGWGKLAELRDALLEFRASGKPIYASFEGGGEAEYLVASVADRIALTPSGDLGLNGLSASALFLRGTFDKLGVKPNFLHVGRYKSAVESYTRTGMSESAREAMTRMLQDTYATLVDSLASSRGLEPDSVRAYMDRGPYSAEDALALGLVDTLLYRPELDSLAVRRAGRGSMPLKLSRYASRFSPNRVGEHIALVTASGEIASGRSRTTAMGERVVGAETLIEALRKVRTRRSIRGVVLRIDSPGGDAQASDEIWREVSRLRTVKPVVVSMSDLAASGGYYIAVAGDTIVAQPGTLTGSIGIFGGKFNVLGLYQKLGMNVETITTGPHAEMYSPFRDFQPEEEAAYGRHLQKSYERFLQRVADGRGLSVEEVDSVAQGRIWSGRSALELGLVDMLGGLEDAIEVVRHRAGIDVDADLVVDRYPEVERPFLQRFLGDLFPEDRSGEGDEALQAIREPMRVLRAAAGRSTGAAMAMLPYTIVIR